VGLNVTCVAVYGDAKSMLGAFLSLVHIYVADVSGVLAYRAWTAVIVPTAVLWNVFRALCRNLPLPLKTATAGFCETLASIWQAVRHIALQLAVLPSSGVGVCG